jgi:amidohydrolase
MRDFLSEAERFADWLSQLRREIHRHPELGYEEERTARLVETCLDDCGIPHERIVGTGVVGVLRGAAEAAAPRCVGLRADMDALPIRDAKEGPLRSLEDGIMHACGHDAHMTCLLGAARLLAAHRGELRGTVKFLFQPGEETDIGGARPMIEAGALENPNVDVLFGLHVDPACRAGAIRVVNGYMQAASDMFDVEVAGRGAHGAYPHLSADPLYAACQCVSALQSVVARNLAPLSPAVLTVGTLHAGTARNVIPSSASFSGIIRTLEPSARAEAVRRFREIVEGTCAALGTEARVEMKAGYPMLKNDERIADFLRAVACETIGAENVLEGTPSLGVEDFAYFAELRPSCFFNLGVGNEARGIVHPLHSDRFDLDEGALPIGAALLAGAAIDFLASA